MAEPLELVMKLRHELDELQTFLALEDAFVGTEAMQEALFAALAHLQSAQAIVDDLGATLAEEEA